jgi:16S rRNA (cytidine1402-2'-O)-methyltransferase
MGQLIIVPTPVGNLGDITLRSIEALKQCDLLLAEDTRVTHKLLQHLGIKKTAFSFHAHNEHRVLQKVVAMIQTHESVALVSDAGTPGISDPGFLLVRECINQGIMVTCLPGSTAFVPALVASGLPCNRFVFEGFLPLKKGRQTRLKELSTENRTVILYESPHRLIKCLNQLQEYFGPSRSICVAREISKRFEELVRGSIAETIVHFQENEPRGEIVLIIAGNEE